MPSSNINNTSIEMSETATPELWTTTSIGDVELTFTCFPSLLTELRHKIWNAIDIEPRLIYIKSTIVSSNDYKVDLEARTIDYPTISRGEKDFQIVATSRPPQLLHLNKESRSVILESYKLAERGSTVYINPSIDILAFEHFDSLKAYQKDLDVADSGAGGDSMLLTKQEVNSKAQHIIITNSCLKNWDAWSENDLELLKWFKGLRTLTISSYWDIFYTPLGNSIEIVAPSDVDKVWDHFWGKTDTPIYIAMRSSDIENMVKKGDIKVLLGVIAKNSAEIEARLASGSGNKDFHDSSEPIGTFREDGTIAFAEGVDLQDLFD